MSPNTIATLERDEVLERLDLMLAVLQLAHHDAIKRAADQLRADPVNAAILDACADEWIGARDLRDRVGKETGVKNRTIQAHVGELVTRRALQQRGATNTRAYRATGLI
jgi:hypothetical protein